MVIEVSEGKIMSQKQIIYVICEEEVTVFVYFPEKISLNNRKHNFCIVLHF